MKALTSSRYTQRQNAIYRINGLQHVCSAMSISSQHNAEAKTGTDLFASADIESTTTSFSPLLPFVYLSYLLYSE